MAETADNSQEKNIVDKPLSPTSSSSEQTARLVVPNLSPDHTFSAEEAHASDELLTLMKDGTVEDVHILLSQMPEGVTSALNAPSMAAKHKLRTPLMSAVASGELAKFTATLNAFDRQFTNKLQRDFEMRIQLYNCDQEGMTMAMMAARSKSVAIVSKVLLEIEQTDAVLSLEAHDYQHTTVLMHAAGVGPAPVFHAVQTALRSALGSEQEFGQQLLLKSADDRTVLMHAAKSRNPMVLKSVKDTVQHALAPRTVRNMLMQKDSDGMNMLMHAAAGGDHAPPTGPVMVDIETVEVPEVAEGGTAKNVGKSTKSSSEGVKLDRSKTEVGQDGLSKAGYTRTSEDASNARISVRKASEDHPLLKATSDASNGPEKAEPQQQKKAETETPATLTKATKLPAKSAMSPIVPVFKISMSFVKECLYRDQMIAELRGRDIWGRSVLTHALLSGNGLMFEAALGSVRDELRDEEVSEMLETNEGEREDTPMISALAQGGTNIRRLFALRVGQLNKDIEARGKLSSITAKIESFIPGKLIVLFQLLLPQIAEQYEMIVLYVFCALAPMLAAAAAAALKTSAKHSGVSARSNKFSVLLAAPAMFFWGVGTSNVGKAQGLQWSDGLRATAMAGATICIPAIDAFLNSRRAARLADRVFCKEWRFNCDSYLHWRMTKKPASPAYPHGAEASRVHELSSYSTFSGRQPSGGLQESKTNAPAVERRRFGFGRKKNDPMVGLLDNHWEAV